MSTDNPESIEFISGPSTVEEYIEHVNARSKESLEINEHNLRLIDEGDTELEFAYTNRDTLVRMIESDKNRLQLTETAMREFSSGNIEPAASIIRQDINYYNQAINQSFYRAGISEDEPQKEVYMQMGRNFIKELNILRNIYQQGTGNPIE